MGKKLLAALLPAAIVALLGAIVAVLVKKALMPEALAMFVWPSLIALGFLAIAFLIFKLGSRFWIWPPLAGFAAQIVGLFLLLLDVFERWTETLIYSLLATAITALVLLTIWLVAMIRARMLEKQMMGAGPHGVDPAKAEEIRKNMREALDMLRKAGGRGRQSVYLLPWFLVVGFPGVGKTEAIRRSGLLSFRKDWIKGIGGTRSLNTFITNDMIFLDTPGRWVKEGSDEESRKEWLEVLRLLRKNRPQRPLDGIMVVVPLDHLMQKSSEELQDQAAAVREVLDLLYDELKFRFPVYLVVSKSDLIEGFGEFFRNIDARQRDQAFGWSHENPNRGYPPKLIRKGLQRVLARLEQYRLEILAQTGSTRQATKLYFFNEEFRRIESPLLAYAEVLFEKGRYGDPPVFRGFYFTSAMQGEGSPVSQAMTEMARSLGVGRISVADQPADKPTSRQFFLLGLLRDLMAGDDGLVGRTVKDWYRRRKSTAFITFAPAALGLLLVMFSGLSLLVNRSTYQSAAERIPAIVGEIEGKRSSDLSFNIPRVLPLTEQIRSYHSRMTGFSPLRSWLGMRRPGRLANTTLAIYRRQLTTEVLDPTLRRAETFALDPNHTITDRIAVLHSVVWLRMARRAQWSGELNSLEKVWELPPDEGATAADELLRQFKYLAAELPESEPLLASFNLAKVAESIAKDPQLDQASSPFDGYLEFQKRCRGASGSQLAGCFAGLRGIAEWAGGDYNQLREFFNELRDDLQKLASSNIEPGAADASRALKAVNMPAEKQGKCLGDFSRQVTPLLNAYLPTTQALNNCKSVLASMSNDADKINTAVNLQKQWFEGHAKDADALKGAFGGFNETCKESFGLAGGALDFELVKAVAEPHFIAHCRGRVEAPRAAASGGGPAPKGGGGSAAPPPEEPSPTAGMHLIAASRGVGPYTVGAWQNKVSGWQEVLAAADNLPASEKRAEQEKVRRDVERYVGEFFNAWRGYLAGLTVRGGGGNVAAWLEQLAITGEYAQVLQRAAEAAQAGTFGEPPFNSLGTRMQMLGDLGGFANTRLAEYQALLGELARDLKQADADGQSFMEFQQKALAGDESTSLIKAQNWVRVNAGGSVAQGTLFDLFMEPIQRAKAFLQSGKAVDAGWAQLVTFYNQRVAPRYPFSGQDATDMIDDETLKSFYKQVAALAGSVDQGGADAGGEGATPALWLRRAKRTLAPMFEPDGVTLKKLRLKVAVKGISYEPEKLADDYIFKELKINFGGGAELTWKTEDGDAPKPIQVPIWGADASEDARIGPFKLTEKKLLKDKPLDIPGPSKSGVWAPLKLLADGQKTGNRVSLVASGKLEESKKPKLIKATIEVESEGLAALLDLAAHGMSAPPGGGSP